MNEEKVHEFCNLHQEYLKKKQEIARLAIELEHLHDTANVCLSESIDSGFDAEWLVSVANEYAATKFCGPLVREFMSKIDETFFKDLEPNLKETLEVTSIEIIMHSDIDYTSVCKAIASSVDVILYDVKTKYRFVLSIPVQNGDLRSNLSCPEKDKVGLYVLKAYSKVADCVQMPPKEICRSFSKDNITIAMRKCLRGDFDKELSVIELDNEKYDTYYSYDIADGIEEILFHQRSLTWERPRLNARETQLICRVASCIDDTKKYYASK